MKPDLRPMLATLTDKPFDDPDWIFETKWDGFRLMAKIKDGSVALYSRNLIDLSSKYPSICRALRQVKGFAVIDGELVALDARGRSRLQLLQNAEREKVRLLYCAFDLIYLDDQDLREHPLIEPNYLAEEYDRDVYLAALEQARAVGAASALSDWRLDEYLPSPSVRTTAGKRAFLEQAAFTHHHPVGTCRMGFDAEAVVGPVDRDPVAAGHAGGEPQPRPREPPEGSRRDERAVGLGAMQVDRGQEQADLRRGDSREDREGSGEEHRIRSIRLA